MEPWLEELRPSASEPRGSAGWRLAKAGWRLVRGSRAALGLAVLLAAAWTAAAVIGYEIGGAGYAARGDLAGAAVLNGAALLAVTFLLGALVAAVDAALDGVELELRDALEETGACARDLFWWAAVTFGFWLFFVLLFRHSPGLFYLADLIWLVVSAFAIPMIAVGGLPPLTALVESASLIRRRWRESLNALVGIGFFTALACTPAAVVFTRGSALAHETGKAQRPLAIVGLALLFLAIGLGVATREAFATMLVRDDFGDLSAREHAGPGLSRSAKAGRVAIGVVVTVAIIAAFSAITQDDRQVIDASSSPGADYFAVASDPGGVPLPSGAPVVYQGRVIGQVLGSTPTAGGLRVSIHVEPGFTPSSTPGYFVVDANSEEPRLLLISSGEAPPFSPPV